MHVKRLLLPLKGKRIDEDTLRLAAKLARQGDCGVVALYVIEVPREYPVDAELPEETGRGEEVLRWVEESLQHQKCKVTAEILQARDAGPAVVQEAIERGVDLILLGMPYKRRHGAFSLGQAVPYILENAPCRVLVLREGIPTERDVQSGQVVPSADEARR